MNVQPNYTLVSRVPAANPLLRGWSLLSRGTFSGTVVAIDIAVIVTMSVLTGTLYHQVVYGELGDVASYADVGALAACIFAVSNFFRGEYRLPNFFAVKPHARRVIRLWNLTSICLLLLGFMAQISVGYSRGWIVVFYFGTLAALIVLRFIEVRVTALARVSGLIAAQRICVIGTAPQITDFIRHYEPWTLGLNMVDCRFLTPVAATASEEIRRDALDRDLAEAVASVRALKPDAIYLLLSWSSTEVIERCAETFLTLPVEIHLGPEQILHKFEDVELAKIGPLASLQLTRMPLSRFEVVQKRIVDFVLATLGLLALSPVLLVVALLIKLDSAGPVFFIQRRYGFNQQPFRIIKFRTMRTMEDGTFVRQTTRDDPRLTRVGRWLRRSNIDEIPQLFNVLTGDMSLVGPRPHALSHDHHFEQRISFYARRHNVKPGITGWAQINGFRGEIDTDEKIRKRVEHDLYYIDNWSLWFDFKILVRTVLSRTAYRNAY